MILNGLENKPSNIPPPPPPLMMSLLNSVTSLFKTKPSNLVRLHLTQIPINHDEIKSETIFSQTHLQLSKDIASALEKKLNKKF
jgi:hypothetical protein